MPSSPPDPGVNCVIELRGLRAFGRHGVLPEETERGQVFVLDVDLHLDLAAAAVSDDLADTVDYGELAERLAEEVGATRFNLLEALAGHLAQIAMADERVRAVEVRVGKPSAPIGVPVADVGVRLRRSQVGPRVHLRRSR